MARTLQWSCYKCDACSFPIHFRNHHENLLTDYVSVQAAHEYKFQSSSGREWSLLPFGGWMELGIFSNHLPTVLPLLMLSSCSWTVISGAGLFEIQFYQLL